MPDVTSHHCHLAPLSAAIVMASADFHKALDARAASKAHEFLKIQAKNPRALRSELELLVLV